MGKKDRKQMAKPVMQKPQAMPTQQQQPQVAPKVK